MVYTTSTITLYKLEYENLAVTVRRKYGIGRLLVSAGVVLFETITTQNSGSSTSIAPLKMIGKFSNSRLHLVLCLIG